MENLLNPRDPVVPSRWKTREVPDFTGLTNEKTEFQIAVSIMHIWALRGSVRGWQRWWAGPF